MLAASSALLAGAQILAGLDGTGLSGSDLVRRLYHLGAGVLNAADIALLLVHIIPPSPWIGIFPLLPCVKLLVVGIAACIWACAAACC